MTDQISHREFSHILINKVLPKGAGGLSFKYTMDYLYEIFKKKKDIGRYSFNYHLYKFVTEGNFPSNKIMGIYNNSFFGFEKDIKEYSIPLSFVAFSEPFAKMLTDIEIAARLRRPLYEASDFIDYFPLSDYSVSNFWGAYKRINSRAKSLDLPWELKREKVGGVYKISLLWKGK